MVPQIWSTESGAEAEWWTGGITAITESELITAGKIRINTCIRAHHVLRPQPHFVLISLFQPEGCLVSDRFHSLQRRNLIETRNRAKWVWNNVVELFCCLVQAVCLDVANAYVLPVHSTTCWTVDGCSLSNDELICFWSCRVVKKYKRKKFERKGRKDITWGHLLVCTQSCFDSVEWTMTC